MVKLVRGVYAAVITPRKANGSLCERSLQDSIGFLLKHGVRGFVLNGATGEYCSTTPDELDKILQAAVEVLPNDAEFLCGIGAVSIQRCLENGEIAMTWGAKALLLPAPHFFAYEQDDLDVFCRKVAEKLPASFLLYHLPQFTGTFECSTIKRLLTECSNIVGIKDSSGSLEILRDLTREGIETCRIVGNDLVLARALEEGVCDGVISGVAGVLPELILSLFSKRSKASFREFLQDARYLDEFTTQISRLPVPWGLKLVAESRGMASASFLQPLSDRRLIQARCLQEWFKDWVGQAHA